MTNIKTNSNGDIIKVEIQTIDPDLKGFIDRVEYLETNLGGKEDKINKVNDLLTPNENTYPSTQAVVNGIAEAMGDIGNVPGIPQWVIGSYDKDAVVTIGETDNYKIVRSTIDNNITDPNEESPWEYMSEVSEVPIYDSSLQWIKGDMVYDASLGLPIILKALVDNTGETAIFPNPNWELLGIMATPEEWDVNVEYDLYGGAYPTIIKHNDVYYMTRIKTKGEEPKVSFWAIISEPIVVGSGLTKVKNNISLGGDIKDNTLLKYKNWNVNFREDNNNDKGGVIEFSSYVSGGRNVYFNLLDEDINGGLNLYSGKSSKSNGSINVGGVSGINISGSSETDTKSVINKIDLGNYSSDYSRGDYSYLELNNITSNELTKRTLRIRTYGDVDRANDEGDAGIFISNTNIYKNERYSDIIKLKEPLKISGESYFGGSLGYENTDILLQIGHKDNNRLFRAKNNFYADGRVSGSEAINENEFITRGQLYTSENSLVSKSKKNILTSVFSLENDSIITTIGTNSYWTIRRKSSQTNLSLEYSPNALSFIDSNAGSGFDRTNYTASGLDWIVGGFTHRGGLYFPTTGSSHTTTPLGGTSSAPRVLITSVNGNYGNVNGEITIPEGATSLQGLTTGNGNNVTNNAIHVTGLNNLDETAVGLALIYDDDSDEAGIARTNGSGGVSSLINFTSNSIYFDLSTPNVFRLRPQTVSDSGAIFNSRVSGSDGVNATDFVTKQQSVRSPTLITDGILPYKEDLNNRFPNAIKGDRYCDNTAIYTPDTSFSLVEYLGGGNWLVMMSNTDSEGVNKTAIGLAGDAPV